MAQLLGTTHSKRNLSLAKREFQVLVGTGLLLMGLSSLVAWPALPFAAEPTSGSGVAVPEGSQVRAPSEARVTPLAELAETLATARTRLEELSRLTKGMAAEKGELEALGTENRKLRAEVRALHADRHQLRDARDAAITQSENLGNALEQASSISYALGEQLAAERQDKSELSRQRDALAAELESSKSAVAQTEAELASLRRELENSQTHSAEAAEQRTQAEAKVAALEGSSSEARQQITALEAQVSALEEQLKAKDAALTALASARIESEELRARLAETEAEVKREGDEKVRLSAELAAFRIAAKTATDLARQHLLTVEGKIRELNQAVSQPPEPEASREPESQPGPGAMKSGAMIKGDLTELRPPSASSGEEVDDPRSPAKGRPAGYRLIPPAHAAEASPGSPLQTMLVDAMRKQREQLQGLMKELDDGRK